VVKYAEPEPTRRNVGWVPLLEKIAAENPKLREDCRKRFSALFGCGCAADGIDAEACAARLAAALGQPLGPYRLAMERALRACAKNIAGGGKPLFSIRNALTLDVGEGGGKVWYSIRECITAKPRAEVGGGREAAPALAEEREGEEEVGEEPEAMLAAEAQEEAALAAEEQVPRGEEEAWVELERFIQEHLPGGHV
jgi:hypothetical protein